MRKSSLLSLILAPILAIGIFIPEAFTCTTFCIEHEGELVFGRNYDWGVSVGLVIVNKKGIQKRALLTSMDVPAEWVSKYGSITFNQYGRELVTGGMNEAGLVVEQMWLSGTAYPEPDERPTLRELSWVQYQLDTAATVDELIASDEKIRISPDSAPLHFLVCDKDGNTATIEFIGGKMKAHKGDDLPVCALANNLYSDSMKYVKQFKAFGGEAEKPATSGSFDRFSGAALGIKEYKEDSDKDIIEHSFKVLDRVSQNDYTQWSIVYDLKSMEIHFKTTKAPEIKKLRMKDFDFDPKSKVKVLDIDTPKAGDVAKRFEDYTMEINKKLIFDAWKNTSFLKNTPEVFLNMVAGYPETLTPAEG